MGLTGEGGVQEWDRVDPLEKVGRKAALLLSLMPNLKSDNIREWIPAHRDLI